MNRCVAATLLIAGLALSSCNLPAASADGDQANHHGRYAGVGLYGPSKQWTRLIANQQTKDPQAARPIDDQVIIVVQDSATGEVRACGDLTGYSIGMNSVEDRPRALALDCPIDSHWTTTLPGWICWHAGTRPSPGTTEILRGPAMSWR